MQPKAIILTPTLAQIEQLRSQFFDRLEREGSPCEGGFHAKDIERIKTANIWLQRFLEQQDLDMKASLDMLWDTCEWRKNFGTNDICLENLNMEYMNAGLMFPRNRDADGSAILILKSKLHIRGARDNEQLLRGFIYWIERMNREESYQLISIFFDLAGTGLRNMDIDYTKQIVNILKLYYPNNLNYIFVFELPWVLTAAFKIIKALLPPKAVASLRFVNAKNLSEYIAEDNMLTCWGGKDDYEFEFKHEKPVPQTNGNYSSMNGETIITTDENDNTTIIVPTKKVHFASNNNLTNTASMLEHSLDTMSKNGVENTDVMLKIAPAEIITFSKVGNELIGTVGITNIVTYPITYKIKTTTPEKFRVRPSTGILTPGSSVTINVVLQPGPNVTLLLTKDKFLVMCMQMSDLNISQQDIADLWKNTQNNSGNVEQHRLKCSIAANALGSNSSGLIDPGLTKNSNIFPINGGIMDADRQWLHVSNSISQLVDTTRRLESRIKFNQKLHWLTVFVFLLLSIAIVYILKIEINSNTEYCLKSSRYK